jgi:hypothetical protein
MAGRKRLDVGNQITFFQRAATAVYLTGQRVQRNKWELTAARVRARVRSCGICGGQSGTGAGFLRVLRFPLPIRIPPIAPQLVWGWYSRPNSGRSTKWTQSRPMRKIKKLNNTGPIETYCTVRCIERRSNRTGFAAHAELSIRCLM